MAYKAAKKQENKIADLKAQLKSGEFDRAYTFFGEEEYLKKEYTDKIVTKIVGADADDFSLIKLDEFTYSFDALADAVENISFIASGKVVIVRGLTADVIKADFDRIKALVKASEGDICIIFYYDAEFLNHKDYDKNRSRRDMINSMSAFSTVVEFEKQTIQALAKWASGVSTRAGARLGEREALYLCQRLGFDMGRIKTETEKLAVYKAGGDILIADIDLITSPSVDVNVFALAKCVMDKTPKKLLSAIADYRVTKEKPTVILHHLYTAFSEMTVVKAALINGIYDEVKVCTDFGIGKNKSFYIREYFRLCKNVELSFFTEALYEIAKCDMLLKGGENESWERVETMCLGLIALLKKKEENLIGW